MSDSGEMILLFFISVWCHSHALRLRDITADVISGVSIRLVKYSVEEWGCADNYHHYVVDYLNPNQPMDKC